MTGFPPHPVCPSCLAPPQPLAAEAFCIQCYAPFNSVAALDHTGRCRLCRSGITEFDALYCVGAYEGRLRELILLLKYDSMASLAKPLGAILRSGYPREASFDLLVPMPIHWRRHRERGFNQAELLALELTTLSSLPVSQAVRRIRHTARQAGLTPKQRRANVRGAFKISNPALVRGKRILLVDDVLTTGASANSCARTLKEAGASSVAILALARADRRVGAGPEAALALQHFE